MRLAITVNGIEEATPSAVGRCPSCSSDMIAKCGHIMPWHWAHRAADCDPWSEPESEWCLRWKRRVPLERTEVVIVKAGSKHRADITLPDGGVLELQASHISADEIAERERFYGHMAWMYRVDWMDRLHFGKHGFWWKQGAKTQATITKPLFWDVGNQIWKVKLGTSGTVFEHHDEHGFVGYEKRPEGGRVLGKIVKRWSVVDFTRGIGGAV